jgi:hypothetical protein
MTWKRTQMVRVLPTRRQTQLRQQDTQTRRWGKFHIKLQANNFYFRQGSGSSTKSNKLFGFGKSKKCANCSIMWFLYIVLGQRALHPLLNHNWEGEAHAPKHKADNQYPFWPASHSSPSAALKAGNARNWCSAFENQPVTLLDALFRRKRQYVYKVWCSTKQANKACFH